MDLSSKYLPSKPYLKKLGAIVLTIVVIFAVRQAYIYGKSYLEARRQGSNVAYAPLLVKDLAVQDENMNGIPDWQDNLGTPIIQPTASEIENSPINETDQFARDLLTTAATISQSGELTEEGALSIAQEVTDSIAATKIGETFTSSDITIIPSTKKNQDAYIAQVIKYLNVQYPLDIDTSITILQAALDAEDAALLTGLDPISARYQKLIEVFKALPVPSSYASDHLEFLHVLSKTRDTIESMRNTFTNPVIAMGVMMNYATTLTDLMSFMLPFTTKLPYSTVATDDEISFD